MSSKKFETCFIAATIVFVSCLAVMPSSLFGLSINFLNEKLKTQFSNLFGLFVIFLGQALTLVACGVSYFITIPYTSIPGFFFGCIVSLWFVAISSLFSNEVASVCIISIASSFLFVCAMLIMIGLIDFLKRLGCGHQLFGVGGELH